jgi:hypothetical protein
MIQIHGNGKCLLGFRSIFKSMNTKDSKLIYEAYNDHPLTEGAQSGGYNQGKGPQWDEYRKKLHQSNPDLPAMRAKAKEELKSKKDQPPHIEPEYSSKEKERLAGFQTEEDDQTEEDENWTVQSRLDAAAKKAGYVDDIQASRYGGDGNEFDPNADLKQEVSDINDLVDAFYSGTAGVDAGEVDPGKHAEVAKAIHAAKKALEGVVGINVDFDVHGKPEGPAMRDEPWQDEPGVYPPGYNQ